MKMILAVTPATLSDQISKSLIDANYRVTKFASTAGLLSGGTTTLMVVTERAMIDRAMDLIRSNVPSTADPDSSHPRVTLYVLNVKDFEQV